MAQNYKIKLASGRVLGPIDIDRVRILVRKNRIVGTEVARLYPQGDWQDINQIPALALLLVESAANASLTGIGITSLNVKSPSSGPEKPGLAEQTRTYPDDRTVPLAQPPEAPLPTALIPPSEAEPARPSEANEEQEATLVATPGMLPPSGQSDSLRDEDQEHTLMAGAPERSGLEPGEFPASAEQISEQAVALEGDFPFQAPATLPPPFSGGAQAPFSHDPGASAGSGIAAQETVMLKLPEEFMKKATPQTTAQKIASGGKKLFDKIKVLAAVAAVLLLGSELLFEGTQSPQEAKPAAFKPFRPAYPNFEGTKAQPQASTKLYAEAFPFYTQDTVTGYKAAAERFRRAVEYDPGNVKALAMLASSYLNLIDASNKDENYFSVISKIIDMSRAKNVDLPETVIADVEFYLVVNKAEAAQNRLIEYTKNYQVQAWDMLYYYALASFRRGDAQNASRYLGQIPDNKAFSAKVFYLRGLVAEQLGDIETSLRELEKAITLNPAHAKSRLRTSEILARRDRLKEGAVHLEYILAHPDLLPPNELAQAYYLRSQLNELFKNYELALSDMERAVSLDPASHEYLLQFYSMRAKSGERNPQMKAEARMYFFLGEGEKLVRNGSFQDALIQFMTAHEQNPTSPIPPMKMGEMFYRQHDYAAAMKNFKLAAERAPNSIEVWSKYMAVLIQNFEWTEAQKAMDRFRKLDVSQSAIDKAAADMYAKQGKHAEAQGLYRKAMARDVIDSGVYIAYAKSLLASKNCKDAPFFFALALRFDPLNTDAIVGTAKCIAATESIDRAISMLQDELQKQSGPKAELLAAVAEFQIQKGAWDQAEASAEQAVSMGTEYALPWKILAQIYMNRAETDKAFLDKALDAYESYSRRNASDPSGYLERYRLFVRKSEYERASGELDKIYTLFPKYPNLHFYKGALYAVMGNGVKAIESFKLELANNPDNPIALIALGRQLTQMSRAEEAVEYLKRAMERAPRNAEAKIEAAYANYLLKNYHGAIALYNAAVALDSGNPTLYKRLGMAYRDLGDGAKAAQAFRKYLEMEPDAPDRAQFERYR